MKNIRLAQGLDKDIEDISNLIYETEMHPEYEWGKGTEVEMRKRLIEMLKEKDNRFALDNIIVCKENENFIGILLSAEGKKIKPLTFKSDIKLLPMQCNLVEKVKYAVFNIVGGYLFYKECNKDEYYLSNIAVKPEYRGKGYGNMLMEAGDNIAREKGYKKISLNANNEKLVKLYEKFGFNLEENSDMKMIKII
ncbi:GNAT family N-acetyltransferase [Clostridium gasigenes]|uniref:GNAT family N-acetyltransferase n=1 Tax=Clostridium gasigenes TaxID=94869 RepID=UPI001C0B7DBC|nr:GNAT family N-acetyltransferase [Clostridium gasigenes]MBU3105217.1 GNAT family N-acetyltransferase [Clostridium gasigenes]